LISKIHVYSAIAVSLLGGFYYSASEPELLVPVYASSLSLHGDSEVGLDDFNRTSRADPRDRDNKEDTKDDDNYYQASEVVANAEADPRNVDIASQKVILDGSDSEGDIKKYSWEYVSGWNDDIDIVDESDEEAYFYSPSVEEPTTLEFKLTVQGEIPESPDDAPAAPETDEDFVRVKINPSMPQIEAVAETEPSNRIMSGETITLDGSKSKGYGEISYKWSVTSPIAQDHVVIQDDQKMVTSIKAPDIEEPTYLIFRLEVADGNDDEDSVEVGITISPREAEALAPVAIAQLDGNSKLNENYKPGDSVVLDGSKSYDPADPENQNNLQFIWEQNEGSDIDLSDEAARKTKPSFVIPSEYDSNDLGFKLVVINENDIQSGPAFISIDIDRDTSDDTSVQVVEPHNVGLSSISAEKEPPDQELSSQQYAIDYSMTNPLMSLLLAIILGAIIFGVAISIRFKSKSHKIHHHIEISTRGGIEK